MFATIFLPQNSTFFQQEEEEERGASKLYLLQHLPCSSMCISLSIDIKIKEGKN